MSQDLKGIMFCLSGYSSSLVAAKLNELGKPYGLTFIEGGWGAEKIETTLSKYNVILLAPHLRALYDDYIDLCEDNNVPLIQLESGEYNASGAGIYDLFERIKTALNLKNE